MGEQRYRLRAFDMHTHRSLDDECDNPLYDEVHTDEEALALFAKEPIDERSNLIRRSHYAPMAMSTCGKVGIGGPGAV